MIVVALVALLGQPPLVEIEEDVYAYVPPGNGSGPMWCSGSTCLVRIGDDVFASGIDTIEGAKPLNNVRWTLRVRGAEGWRLVALDEDGRTREPCPIVALGDDAVLLSANPTLTEPEAFNGPAQPVVERFLLGHAGFLRKTLLPRWHGEPEFTEHSYRSFTADGPGREALLLQNVGYDRAEWSFLDAGGEWSAAGTLFWPTYESEGVSHPLRLCYPDVALVDRAVAFVGVSDIIEPNPEWRAFKRELTGQEWDYDFRRLFYAWCPDITTGEFSPWLEIASREETCGWISPGDLWFEKDGRARVVWTERAIDERLRDRFFPQAKQRYALEYAEIANGEVILRRTLLEGGEGIGGLVPGQARFHGTPDGALYVVCYVGGSEDGQAVSENRLLRLGEAGEILGSVVLPFEHPFVQFFTAGVRGGSAPSPYLDLLGECVGVPNTVRYARVRLPDGLSSALVPASPPD